MSDEELKELEDAILERSQRINQLEVDLKTVRKEWVNLVGLRDKLSGEGKIEGGR